MGLCQRSDGRKFEDRELRHLIGGSHLSNTACLTHEFFRCVERCSIIAIIINTIILIITRGHLGEEQDAWLDKDNSHNSNDDNHTFNDSHKNVNDNNDNDDNYSCYSNTSRGHLGEEEDARLRNNHQTLKINNQAIQHYII